MANEHPILFSGEMVRAILDGRKTQTRRVITPQPPKRYEYKGSDGGNSLLPKKSEHYWMNGYAMWRPKQCPYGKVGDRLWVREAWGFGNCGKRVKLVAPQITLKHRLIYEADNLIPSFCKRSPIFMPKWATRIWLEITGIRVERVQNISIKDLYAEGMQFGSAATTQGFLQFAQLWDSINTKRGYGWEKNPYVWVIEFKQEMPDGK